MDIQIYQKALEIGFYEPRNREHDLNEAPGVTNNTVPLHILCLSWAIQAQ